MNRKFLAVFLALALIFVGGEAALAAIPHSHGQDFDHSHHGACPVYQLASHGINFSTVATFVFAVAFAFVFFRAEAPSVFFASVLVPQSSRAPPAL